MIPNVFSERPAWQDHAACRGMDPNIFFPERGQDSEAAKRVCMRCPVRERCLDYAEGVPKERSGVWGGLSGRERKRIRRGQLPVRRAS